MTVSSETAKHTYTGDGATTSFAFSFPILDETHLLVQIKDTDGVFTTKVLTTDYTVTGSGNDSGSTNYSSGNVVFGAGDIPASTDTVVITRNVPLKQQTDYTENDVFPAESHEEALDELTMIAQQINEEVARSVKFDAAVTETVGEMPTPTADYYLKRNSDNDGFEWQQLSTSAGLGNIVEDLTPQLGADLDTNSFDIQFDDAKGIRDDSDNEQLIFQKTTSAVNHIDITNAATGNGPSIASVGDDTNVDLTIDTKGTGTLSLGSADTTSIAIGSTVTIPDEIQHTGDTNNKIGFTTDTQTFTTGGSTRMDITDSGIQLGAANARVTTILDEDLMGSDSATALATQQSIKAYVDSSVANYDYELIATASASASSSVVFTDLSSTYHAYKIIITNLIPGTDATAFYLRTSTNNGSSYDNGASDYAWVTDALKSNTSPTSTLIGDEADSEIQVGLSAYGSGTNETANIEMTIYNPSAAAYAHIDYKGMIQNATPEIFHFSGGGMRLSAGDVDAIQFLFSAGTVGSGEFRVYGIRNA